MYSLALVIWACGSHREKSFSSGASRPKSLTIFQRSLVMQRSRKIKRKQVRKRAAGGAGIRALLSDSPAYPGQVVVKATLPGTSTKLTTTVTTGVIASALQVSSAQLLGFATRFGSTFDEYRIIGVDAVVSPLAATAGVLKCWFDEKSTSAPTANESLERTAISVLLNNAMGTSKSLRWRARDLLDLQYTAIGSAVTPVTFKQYTDNANWGSSAVVTDVAVVQFKCHLEFRGLKST